MEQNDDRRHTTDRRDSNNEQAEKFVKYFIPEEKEQRDGKDRRKSNSDTE